MHVFKAVRMTLQFRNSSFGWVELNIILFFLNSENFEFSGRKGLYFRTEGVQNKLPQENNRKGPLVLEI